MVDPGPPAGEFTGLRCRGVPRQHLVGGGGGECGGQFREPPGGYEVVGEPAEQRVGSSHGGPGEGEMGAEPTRRAPEEPGPADVGDEADAGLGHGDAGALGDDPNAAVGRDTDAAAHDDAVHEGHVRLGVAGDAGVEPVLVAPETGGGGVPGLGVVVDGADVAARAQPALSGTADQDLVDGGVLLPGAEGLVDPQHHGVGEGVEGLGAIEGDHRGPALNVEQDGAVGVVFFGLHADQYVRDVG